MTLAPPPRQFCPAVSIIIPMYNTEKFIGDCLESLLAQTFQDFEVVVADDCSTDSSVQIVESYMEKFGGRLRLVHTEKNSGNCAIPKNRGFKFSRGKYAFFMDSDDMIAPNALEKLYSIMESHTDVDLIYCTANYVMSEDGGNFQVFRTPKYNPETMLTAYDNLTERLNDIIQQKFHREPWRSFVRRDFLVEHEIYFPNLKPGDDAAWFYISFFYVKKILLLSEPVYIYRYVNNSIMHLDRTPEQMINHCVNPIILGSKILDDYMSKLDFFHEHPEYRYGVLQSFMIGYFNRCLDKSNQISSAEVYEAIKERYGKNLGEYDVLVSALCTLVNAFQRHLATRELEFKKAIEQKEKALEAKKQEFNELAAQVQQVIDELEKNK